MIYFSSDLHLNHPKDFIYKPRGFNSIKEMNKEIITRFHSVIKPDDDLYLLGDIFLGTDLEDGIRLFQKLPGKIHLIWGNHDTTNRKIAMSKCSNVEEIIGFAGMITYNHYHFYLSHFPTLTTNFDDIKRPINQRTLCLAGHTHSKLLFDETCHSLNVSVDAHDCYPISIESIISFFEIVGNSKTPNSPFQDIDK